ncbi:MAG TPA: tripartite tricarboxylate transporter substrate binding protein [Burkholderiales bacterium]|nr:tripartite tricarboxylate transporter substrate binding protein [Burkholderiales bacterium]
MKRLLLVLALLPAMAWAQYPNKPIRMIVPFAPGGASDFVGRILQPRMSELFGQQVVVENRAGASGNIGMEAAAKSAPDGYTIYLGNIGTVALNPAVFTKLQVKPTRDFIAITQVVDVPGVLVVHPDLQAKTVKDIVAIAKAYPGKLNYGSPGAGSQNRLETEVFRKIEGLDMVHVPYKGGAGPAIAGLVGGETHLMFVTASSAMNHVKSGRLRLIAVTSAKRLAAFPDTPTMAESGYPQLTSGSWQGIFVPAGTPKEVVDKLYAVTIETMKSPEVQQRLANGGVEVVTSAPGEFAKFVAKETERWGQAVREAGATAE